MKKFFLILGALFTGAVSLMAFGSNAVEAAILMN
jgi:hypothetical protein